MKLEIGENLARLLFAIAVLAFFLLSDLAAKS